MIILMHFDPNTPAVVEGSFTLKADDTVFWHSLDQYQKLELKERKYIASEVQKKNGKMMTTVILYFSGDDLRNMPELSVAALQKKGADITGFKIDPALQTEELKRKIRIAAGGVQCLLRLPELLLPYKQPILGFEYISHRVLRWVVTPYLLLMVFILNR